MIEDTIHRHCFGCKKSVEFMWCDTCRMYGCLVCSYTSTTMRVGYMEKTTYTHKHR